MTMDYPFYFGDADREKPDTPTDLPVSRRESYTDPSKYIASEGLQAAANVALLLGQPLLLTGEPGTGKTQFASSLAWELGYGEPIKFETKSTSAAKDLFYTYDALRRFQDAQTSVNRPAMEYIEFNALGEAILRSLPKAQRQGPLAQTAQQVDAEPNRSVVLIDEIDKAPRDFPNDILNELDNLYFRITELDNLTVRANSALRPVVIIASNSERDLPDPFLRRCIYYHIPFPDTVTLQRIVALRLGLYESDGYVLQGVAFFQRLRQEIREWRKPPATAELLDWMTVFQDLASRLVGGQVANPMVQTPKLLRQTLGSLAKTTDDLHQLERFHDQWLNNISASPGKS